MDNSRELFHSTYNIDASNVNVSYTFHTCNCTMSIFRDNRHMQSIRHIKNINKNKCKKDSFIIHKPID